MTERAERLRALAERVEQDDEHRFVGKNGRMGWNFYSWAHQSQALTEPRARLAAILRALAEEEGRNE